MLPRALARRVLQTRTRKFMKIWTSTNFGKFLQYCVHFLTTTPRAASFIPLQSLGSLKSSYLGRGIFLFAWFRIFLLLFPVVLRSWQVWQWKEEIATLRNMEEENTEPGCLGGGSTQILFGGGGTAVMTSVRLEMWKLPLYTSQRWATDGDTNLTITAKYQTTHKNRLFREKQSWIGLSGRFKWLVVKGGRGELTPPSLVPILSGSDSPDWAA